MINDMKLKLILEAVDKASPELNKVDGGVSKLDTTVGKVGRQMKIFGGIMAGLALGKLASDFVSVNVEFDRLEASLVTVTGSEAEAQAAFNDIKDFASTTPYQLSQVTDAFIKMKALGLDASMASLRSYGNTASAMGKDLNQMIEAVADASTGEFERLKEFGIKARQNGDKVNFIFRGVTTEVKNSASDIESYLRHIGDVEFAGGMDRQMKTLGGSLSNLSDEWSKFVRALGEDTGAADAAAGSLNRLTTSLKNLTNALHLAKELQKGNVSFFDWLFAGPEDTAKILKEINGRDVSEQAIADAKRQIEKMQAELAMGGSNPRRAQELKQDIAYLKESIVEFEKLLELKKELESAVKHNASTPFTDSPSGTENPYLDTGEVVPSSDDQWLIRVQKELEAVRVEQKKLYQNNLKKYAIIAAEGIAAGNATPADSWMTGDFEKGLEAATERMWEMQEASDTWQASLMDGLDDLADYYDETFGDRMTGTVNSAFSSMEDTMVDFIMTGKASFKDMINSILADIARLTVQQNISSPLASALNTGLSGLFGSAPVSEASNLFGGEIYAGATAGEMSSFFANANGNAFSNGRVIPFANGTIVAKPTYFPIPRLTETALYYRFFCIF